MAGGIGAIVAAPGGDNSPAIWFGEDQGRYLLAARADKADEILRAGRAGGRCRWRVIGETGGDSLRLGAATPVLVRELLEAHEDWMPTYMAGGGKAA